MHTVSHIEIYNNPKSIKDLENFYNYGTCLNSLNPRFSMDYLLTSQETMLCQSKMCDVLA